MECVAAKDGIRVCSVQPGIIRIRIWSRTTSEATESGKSTPMQADELKGSQLALSALQVMSPMVLYFLLLMGPRYIASAASKLHL